MPNEPSTDYSQYTIRDFVLDESFRRWVLQPDEETMSFWHTFMLRHPERQLVVDDAASLLLHLRANYDDLTDASYERIRVILDQAHAEQFTPVVDLNSRSSVWTWLGKWKVAAAAIGLLGTLATGWYIRESRHQHKEHTAFGETRTLTLPDGSTVQLNGNSTLTYQDDWDETHPREVWLDGEGFFTVAKKAVSGQRVKFTTHTPGLDVQVLGTQFNVHSRRGQTDVTLVEGKVELIRPGETKARILEMKPGQIATAKPGIEQVAVQETTPEIQTAWTQKQFIFDKTPLREVGQQLSDSYGLTLVFDNEALAARQFTGNLSSQDVETLLTTLAATFDLTIERDSNIIYLRKNK
ncbi:FecR family protein [Fibrella forsythiae]|uniref:FecR domain-containing protein n=1 Tax=Fibrella forsythiae TaxID=2817061 RepID=A0ABS3JF53_9BACT|nr:FecR domain-containing protein [Fibrella forsythiae]MBO0948076.1 FecR domain-containing protein [Fibrella forsythiae]